MENKTIRKKARFYQRNCDLERKTRGSQNKEELLVDARDAGDDAERQDAAAEPHMNGFEPFPEGGGGAGQEEGGHAHRPLDQQTSQTQ